MTTDTLRQQARLQLLLNEALGIADALGQPLVAIHIAEAIDLVPVATEHSAA